MSDVDWSKAFPIGVLYRFDLQRIGWTNAQIDSLSDVDMLTIANKMQGMHLRGEFWNQLEAAAGEVLQEKESTTT